MKNMKLILIAAFAFATLATSCSKDNDLVQPQSPTQVQCCDELDSVNAYVYLLDFDIEYRYSPASIDSAPLSRHFVQPYVVTRSGGVALDSVPLSIVFHENSIDTTFSFSNAFTHLYNEIYGLKINKLHETTMEIWSDTSSTLIPKYALLATFYIAKTGFYDVFENYAGATSTMCPTNSSGVADERFKVLTRM